MPDKFGDLARLLHVLDSIEEIKQYTLDAEFEDFEDQSMMKNACIRQLEIIGEACNRISEEIRLKYPRIEWSQIIGLRNILIHQYFGVDDRVIWDIIKQDLIDLESKIKEIVKDLTYKS
jgi:uncharacterized protein with HEPN domain